MGDFFKSLCIYSSCLFRWCVYWWSVLMYWSCSWMRRLCPEEWRWGFNQKEHFMLGVPLSSVFTDDCFCFFLCLLGPSPGDGLLLHVRLTGCCSSSSPYPVSLSSCSPMSLCTLQILSHISIHIYMRSTWAENQNDRNVSYMFLLMSYSVFCHGRCLTRRHFLSETEDFQSCPPWIVVHLH